MTTLNTTAVRPQSDVHSYNIVQNIACLLHKMHASERVPTVRACDLIQLLTPSEPGIVVKDPMQPG